MGFIDVPAGNWEEDAILAAKAAGIMAGKSADTFGHGQPVTREELAAVVAKLWKKDKNNQPGGFFNIVFS